MSRYVTDHRVNGLNDALTVLATDEPGPGGANHSYSIYFNEVDAANGPIAPKPGVTVHVQIQFQLGGVAESGVNGVSNEALVAVVIDRLRGFQGGQYACRENAVALTNLEQALMWMHKRTRDRIARGVEGMQKP